MRHDDGVQQLPDPLAVVIAAGLRSCSDILGPNLLLVSQAGGGVELDLALAVNAVQQLAAHG